MNNLELAYKEIYHRIQQANNILVVAHVNPDPDTISAVCAMSCLLEQLNKNYISYCLNQIPYQFNFLPYSHKIQFNNEIDFAKFDLIITMDCGNLSRTGIDCEISNRNNYQYVINIDHHIKTDSFADLEIKDPNVCATAEILYDFFKINQIKIDENIAECILTGILADSGNLLFSNTTEKNITIAAEMLNYGASWFNVLSKISRNKQISTLKIWGKAISRLRINKKYNCAFTLLSGNDIKNIDKEELEGLPEFLSTISNVKFILLLKEQDNLIKGNIRSNYKNMDISILANILGGGGNKKTAGFIIRGHIGCKEKGWKIY